MIHILHHQTDRLLGILDNKSERAYWNDSQTQGIDGYNVLQFSTFADTTEASYLVKRSRILIKGENDYWQEYIVFESNSFTSRDMEIVATGSEAELDGQRIIQPGKHDGKTTKQYVDYALTNTDWKPGNVEGGGVRTIELDEYIGGYEFLLKVAKEFDMELVFRVEIDGNAITGRYVDLVQRIGRDTAKEFEYGKDLIGIERKVFSDRIITGVFAIGPERDDGTRLTLTETDDNAFQRWNRNGQHILAIYEPQTEDKNMTETRLRQLARMELAKRIDAVTEYSVTAESIEHLYEHEAVRLGDTVRVIDREFNPPLFATARVIQVTRSLDDTTEREYTIGSVVEYDESELRKTFLQLQKIYGTTVIRAQVPPAGSSSVIWIDTSGKIDVPYTWNGIQWVKFVPTDASDIGAATTEEAQAAAELESIKAIRRILVTAHSGYDLEYQLLDGNKYIADTIYRDDLDTYKAEYDAAKEAMTTAIDGALIDDEITPAERAEIIAAIDAMEAAQGSFQWALTRAQAAVSDAQALEAKQQAELAEKAAADALEKADTALTDVISKVDQSAYDTKIGELVNELADKAGIQYVDDKIATIDVNIATQPTAPESPELNDLWMDTTSNALKRWDGTKWVSSEVDLSELDTYTKTEIDNALNGKVSTITYSADKAGLIADIETNTTAISQNTTDISLKADKTVVDALAGTVTSQGTAIAQNAEAIALSATKEDIDGLEIRVSDVELSVSDSAIISAVTSSKEFEIMLDGKADASDLSGYATSEALDALYADVQANADELAGIRIGNFVTKTELEQRDLSLLATISASSGVNLIRNSVGLARMEHWNVSGSGTVSSTASAELNGLGYHSGFYLKGGDIGITKMSQDIAVVAGKSYTVSFAIRNVSGTGDVVVRLLDAVSGEVLGTAPAYSGTGAGDYGDIHFTVANVPSAQIRLEINVPQTKQAIVTALMMNIGAVPFSWTTAVGELYNTTIRMDLNGLRVSQNENGLEVGFTVMTPEKFAGYYNESGVIDEGTGSDDEVFRMDKDEFVMKKAVVKEEITMGNFKVINVNESSRKGWAFVPNTQ